MIKKRLTREESREIAHEKLLDAALRSFDRVGYHGASVDYIANEAGFSKGAVYSHFKNKDALFLAAAQRHQQDILNSVRDVIEHSHSNSELIENLSFWADKLVSEGKWCQMPSEYERFQQGDAGLRDIRSCMLRENWKKVGDQLIRLFSDDFPMSAETLGALFFSLVHAPVSGVTGGPGVGGVVAATFSTLLQAYGAKVD